MAGKQLHPILARENLSPIYNHRQDYGAQAQPNKDTLRGTHTIPDDMKASLLTLQFLVSGLVIRSATAFGSAVLWSVKQPKPPLKRSRAIVSLLQSESEPVRADQNAKDKLQIQIEYCGG